MKTKIEPNELLTRIDLKELTQEERDRIVGGGLSSFFKSLSGLVDTDDAKKVAEIIVAVTIHV